jgi:hypothetical protein
MNYKTIIGIPPCAATNTLKSLHHSNLKCEYMGLDQSGRILMQVNYVESQAVYIKELIAYVEKNEQVFLELSGVINETLNKYIAKKEEKIKKTKKCGMAILK